MAGCIVVIGASAGIGLATARRFAAAGQNVVLVGRRAKRLSEAADAINAEAAGKADFCALDMSRPQDAEALKAHVQSSGCSVRAIICCAGAAPQTERVTLAQIAEEWQATFQANVMPTVLPVEALLPLMEEGGSIVLYSSIAAYRGLAMGGSGAYGAVKSAMHSLTHTWARRLGGRDINVNAIAPGYIAETEIFGDMMNSSYYDRLVDETLLKRPGYPRDAAGLSFFLCSSEGHYITSQIIQINGGSLHGM